MRGLTLVCMASGLLLGCYSSESTLSDGDARSEPPRDVRDTTDGPADVAADEVADPVVDPIVDPLEDEAEDCIDLSGDWFVTTCSPSVPYMTPVVITQMDCEFSGVVDPEGMSVSFAGIVYSDSTVWVWDYMMGGDWYGSATESRIELEITDGPWHCVWEKI